MMHSLTQRPSINALGNLPLISRLKGDLLLSKKFQCFYSLGVALSIASSTAYAQPGFTALQTRCTPEFAELEPPALPPREFDINDIAAGDVSFQELVARGFEMFTTRFTLCDGQGRPANSGSGELVDVDPQRPLFARLSGPDSNACADCHNGPVLGGSGGFVQDAFAGALPSFPQITEVDTGLEAPRNPPALQGACVEELLANEITADLQAQLATLLGQGAEGPQVLVSKGIEFEIVIEDGEVVESRGINPDLNVLPFTLSGSVPTIRAFEVDAMNVHFGMQAEEAFDLNPERGPDFDRDGIANEVTRSDVTALVTFVCSLPIPQQVIPASRTAANEIADGEENFNDIGCNRCHINELTLNSPDFTEPNPRNEEPLLRDPNLAFRFNAVLSGNSPRLAENEDGTVTIRAFTDFKRHNLCDPEGSPGAIRHFCNEVFLQARQPEQDGRPGGEFFLTKDLWDVGNTAPYGHRGDLTTITEAILAHGGEARQERDDFVDLSSGDKRSILAFLRSLQVPTNIGNQLAFVPADEPQQVVVQQEEVVEQEVVNVEDEEIIEEDAQNIVATATAFSNNGPAVATATATNSPNSSDALVNQLEEFQRTVLERLNRFFSSNQDN